MTYICFEVKRLVVLRVYVFVLLLFLLVSRAGCGLWLWHTLDLSINFFALYLEDYLMYEHHSSGLWVITNKQMYEKQGHWTLKNRSCWPWLYDPQVNVTRLSHVSLTIFISCFHNRKVEKHFLKVSLILTSSPTLGSGVMEWKPTLQGTYGPNMNVFWWVVGEIYPTWETLT